jgi:hypothetical protein
MINLTTLGFEVLTVVIVESTVFSNVMLYILAVLWRNIVPVLSGSNSKPSSYLFLAWLVLNPEDGGSTLLQKTLFNFYLIS